MVACVVSAHACVVWSHALTARRRMIVLRGRRACLLAGEYNRWDGYMDRRGGRPGRTGIRGAIVPGAGPVCLCRRLWSWKQSLSRLK